MKQPHIDIRRERVRSTIHPDVTLAVHSGAPIPKPGGLDQTYPFTPHPEYYWLSGSRRPHGITAFSPDEGWVDFVAPITAAERLWDGEAEAAVGRDVAEFAEWSASQRHPVVSLGAGARGEDPLALEVQDQFDRARRPKDALELTWMRQAAAATAAGHHVAREAAGRALTERQIQIELESAMFMAGADEMGYGTIVASGPRSAILHGHPTQRRTQPGEFVLVDAGGVVNGYTADVTRTYAFGGWDTQHQAIYDIVLEAELAGIAAVRPGIEWHEIHRIAAHAITRGLVDLRILVGDPEQLAEDGVVSLFFPHGVGHMVGLGVRDVGGRATGREPGRKCCGAGVRVDLPLEAGFVMTVEPGLYFVDGLLNDAKAQNLHAGRIDWDEVEKWLGLGGVRLEDNILVTTDGHENLTESIPK